MDYSTYTRYIYEWLTNSGLSGSTTTLVSVMNTLNNNLIQVNNKLDGLSMQLDELLADTGRMIYIGLFGVLLWFAMQFVQKRWYTS